MPQSTFSTMLELCSLIVNDCGLIKMSNNWYFNKNHALWDIYKKTQIFEKVEIRDTTLYLGIQKCPENPCWQFWIGHLINRMMLEREVWSFESRYRLSEVCDVSVILYGIFCFM